MILTFSGLGTYGRFGNQLFQIAGVKGLAHKYNAAASFPEWNYERHFLNPLPHNPEAIISNIPQQVKEKYYHYHDWDIKGDSDILGYLQSEKYFVDISDEIKKQFTFNPGLVSKVKSSLPVGLFEKPTILMQVRRTDYVTTPYYYNCPPTYYIQALITHFPDWQNCNLVFISDDLAWCKIHFEFLANAFFIDVIDIEQIVVATMCDHFIIANSSFGWWGAWLGEKPQSKVIYPGHMFREKILKEQNDMKDWAPDRWIKFEREDYKIDLTDCTFTIPVYYDHPDRESNLALSVCMLQKSFDTKIIIGEHGIRKFEYFKQWCNYMFFEGMSSFHRTKMLNDMAVAADTPYIANWDCDVIIPPMQIYMTMLKLRDGCDMVFPYDGRFARLPRLPYFKEIEKIYDIAAIGDTTPRGNRNNPVFESSVGGAVFFNKESFIDGGMENEYMISFGPEDCERNDRFKKLGFKVERIPGDQPGTGLGGCLYHIDHHVGVNSSAKNPHFTRNNQELEKIRRMSRDELRLFVDTWPWRHKYTENYYNRISEGAIKSAEEVYKALNINFDNPVRIIDIGCGVGEWSCGNKYYTGVDYRIPKRSLMIPADEYHECNLETDIFKSSFKYDLALCLEVAEHISEARADILIEMLCNLSDQVLFSAAIPHQGGTGHVNEQWQSWWAEKFAVNGFCAADEQPEIKHNAEIELWYRQNIVLYVRQQGNTKCRMVWDYVHPKYYDQIAKYLKRRNVSKLQETEEVAT